LNDLDQDRVCDGVDNCPSKRNPDQLDSDRKNGGDVCDPCPLDVTDVCKQIKSGGVSMDAAGGMLATSDGKVSITVPPGALSEPRSISITEGLRDFELVGSGTIYRIELGPDGQTFPIPVTVRFGWNDANNDRMVDGTLPPLDERRLRVYRNGDPQWFAGSCGDPAFQAPACTYACCDMVANTWSLQLTSFSQYVVGDEKALLIAGGGPEASDCLLEWNVVDPQETPQVTSKGLLNPDRRCVDGDPLCDADATVNGVCAFRVSVCTNVEDGRLLARDGSPACASQPIERITIKQPRPGDHQPVRDAAGRVLHDLFAGLGTSQSAVDGEEILFSPPLATHMLCSLSTQVSIPLSGKRRVKLTIVVRTTTPASAVLTNDKDRLRLECLAAP
jgi:hypothetical protein